MIERSLLLQTSINRYCADLNFDTKINLNDWKILETLRNILKPASEMNTYMQTVEIATSSAILIQYKWSFDDLAKVKGRGSIMATELSTYVQEKFSQHYREDTIRSLIKASLVDPRTCLDIVDVCEAWGWDNFRDEELQGVKEDCLLQKIQPAKKRRRRGDQHGPV